MRELLTHVFTGPDNATFDGARVMGGVAFAWWLAMSTYSVAFKGQPWDMVTSSAALAALVVGICGAVRVKASAEPPA